MNVTERHKSIYTCIGQRIRERRKLLKLNQAELAAMMGFSYQQMQKYENGMSHVSAGKLLLFSHILNVPPAYFYEGITLDEGIGQRIATDIIQKSRTEPLCILQVEDNPADVIQFRAALDGCSERTELYSIHDASLVMDFLQNHDVKYGRRVPDIIVLDLDISGTNGLDILKSIKRHPKTAEMPVVILTNSISVRDMVEAYRLGAAGFIQKSVDQVEYTESIEIMVKYWSKTVALPCM